MVANTSFLEWKRNYEEKKKLESENKPEKLISIHDRMKEQISLAIAEIEEVIDKFVMNNYETDFSMRSFLDKNGIKSTQAKAIAEYYNPQFEELQIAKDKSDPDISEGYSNMKPSEIFKFYNFMNEIITNCQMTVDRISRKRKPRKKKVKKAETLIKKFQYMKEEPNLKIVSFDPTRIIGSSQVVLYDTKNKILKILNCEGKESLTIKGTTIYNFNPETSKSKRIGEKYVKSVVPEFLGLKKTAVKNKFKELRNTESDVNGRVNENTLILAIN